MTGLCIGFLHFVSGERMGATSDGREFAVGALAVRWATGNLQNHKTIFENQNSHIPRTHSQASWTLETYISQTCTSQMCTHGGVYLVNVHLTYTGVHLVHKRVPYGRAPYGRASHGC